MSTSTHTTADVAAAEAHGTREVDTGARADVIDLLAGIGPGDALAAVRAQRPQARANAQASFEALFEPESPGAFSYAERYAVATFVARLHGFERAAGFYADLLGDAEEALVAVVEDVASDALRHGSSGPTGAYREPGLAAEGVAVSPWTVQDDARAALGGRLAASVTHAHLLVVRPREASPGALRDLVAAGWNADEIVSLSQLVAFLSFQLRAAWGLTVLASAPDAGRPTPTPTPTAEEARA